MAQQQSDARNEALAAMQLDPSQGSAPASPSAPANPAQGPKPAPTPMGWSAPVPVRQNALKRPKLSMPLRSQMSMKFFLGCLYDI